MLGLADTVYDGPPRLPCQMYPISWYEKSTFKAALAAFALGLTYLMVYSFGRLGCHILFSYFRLHNPSYRLDLVHLGRRGCLTIFAVYLGLNLKARSCQCLSNLLSKAWTDGTSTTFLGKLFQCFGVRHLKECFRSSVLACC